MAVFLINVCKFNDCGLIFQSLADLIQHIEENHIDYDPHVIEQKEQEQPQCLPLSYILRFYADDVRKETDNVKPKIMPVCKPSSISMQTVTPNGSDVDDDEMASEYEDSNDSWATSEEFSSEFILRHGSKMANASSSSSMFNSDKPFACPVPGCKKRYKNVNGIKYHSKNGHKNDGRVRKAYKCQCGKSYKSGSGLRNHVTSVHANTNGTTVTTQGGDVLHVPSSQVTTLQPIRALTLKHIANLGLPLKTLVVTTKSPVDKLPVVKPSTAVGGLTSSSSDMSSLGILTPATSPQSSSSTPSPPLVDNNYSQYGSQKRTSQQIGAASQSASD